MIKAKMAHGRHESLGFKGKTVFDRLPIFFYRLSDDVIGLAQDQPLVHRSA
jgi:hypothetical protein